MPLYFEGESMTGENKMPIARQTGLVVQEASGETLIYDLERHKAHCLNASAALVWRYSDGQSDVRTVASELCSQLGLPDEPDVVWVAVEQLRKANLLEFDSHVGRGTRASKTIGHGNAPSRAGSPVSHSRRSALRRIGLVGGAAALAPLVTSIIAPTAVSAATCLPTGSPCTSGTQCCSTICDVGGTGLCK